jgi:8-oxo-dGTP pyrophosphatase MutT (NUDIX family)
MMDFLKTAGLVVIKNRKLLLAYSINKQAFYLPGGKCDPGETSLETLQREIEEELNLRLEEHELQYYTHISAPAFGEFPPIMMEQDCYLYELNQKPSVSREIAEIQYFDSQTYSSQPSQAPGVILIMQQLKRDNLID